MDSKQSFKAGKVRKAVIPAAGFGTRFLPQTKAMPKEMLPIVDKPIIQYVVEECVDSGIEDIIIVTGYHKRSIEDHFDHNSELEFHLEAMGKKKRLKMMREIVECANIMYIRQKGKLGNGTPILNAAHTVGDEPFAVLWGDEFISASPPRLKQCLDVFEKYGEPVISGIKIENREDLSKYGIADLESLEGNVSRLKRIIEKPDIGKAPSEIAAHGCYVLTPDIFPILAELKPGKEGEIWLVDAIAQLSLKRDILICEIKNAKYHDTGDKLEYLKTVVEFGLRHPDIDGSFRDYLKKLKL